MNIDLCFLRLTPVCTRGIVGWGVVHFVVVVLAQVAHSGCEPREDPTQRVATL